MDGHNSTCWTLLRDAAAGGTASRQAFGVRYAPVVRSYLAARWRGTPLVAELDDAVQDVFVECLRSGGLLDRARDDAPGGFRAFLYGAVRHVAQRCEARRARLAAREPLRPAEVGDAPARDEALSRVFDRAYARSLMREAAERQAELAAERGADALRRVELLRLRFQDGLPIREIAALWNVDAAGLHREYARARQEFRAGARAKSSPPTARERLRRSSRKCADLLALLQ